MVPGGEGTEAAGHKESSAARAIGSSTARYEGRQAHWPCTPRQTSSALPRSLTGRASQTRSPVGRRSGRGCRTGRAAGPPAAVAGAVGEAQGTVGLEAAAQRRAEGTAERASAGSLPAASPAVPSLAAQDSVKAPFRTPHLFALKQAAARGVDIVTDGLPRIEAA